MFLIPLSFYPSAAMINGIALEPETFLEFHDYAHGLTRKSESQAAIDMSIQLAAIMYCQENMELIDEDPLNLFALYYRYIALNGIESVLPDALTRREGPDGPRIPSIPALKAASQAELLQKEVPKERAHLLPRPYFDPNDFMALARVLS
jgi:hypothetical protein